MSDPKLDLSGNYTRFDNQTWPLPSPELGDALRYSVTFKRDELLHAASIMNAYRALILMPEKKRRVVIRQIRRARELKADTE